MIRPHFYKGNHGLHLWLGRAYEFKLYAISADLQLYCVWEGGGLLSWKMLLVGTKFPRSWCMPVGQLQFVTSYIFYLMGNRCEGDTVAFNVAFDATLGSMEAFDGTPLCRSHVAWW